MTCKVVGIFNQGPITYNSVENCYQGSRTSKSVGFIYLFNWLLFYAVLKKSGQPYGGRIHGSAVWKRTAIRRLLKTFAHTVGE